MEGLLDLAISSECNVVPFRSANPVVCAYCERRSSKPLRFNSQLSTHVSITALADFPNSTKFSYLGSCESQLFCKLTHLSC